MCRVSNDLILHDTLYIFVLFYLTRISVLPSFNLPTWNFRSILTCNYFYLNKQGIVLVFITLVTQTYPSCVNTCRKIRGEVFQCDGTGVKIDVMGSYKLKVDLISGDCDAITSSKTVSIMDWMRRDIQYLLKKRYLAQVDQSVTDIYSM